jgi:hypothetical protein
MIIIVRTFEEREESLFFSTKKFMRRRKEYKEQHRTTSVRDHKASSESKDVVAQQLNLNQIATKAGIQYDSQNFFQQSRRTRSSLYPV